MTKIIGRLKEIGVAKETVRGAGASPAFIIPKVDFTVNDKVVKARTKEGYGNIVMEGSQAIPAKQWAEGEIGMDMLDKNFGLFLFALLGSKSVSGPSDSAYTHTFTLDSANNQHQSLALSMKESTISQYMYKLAMINSMTMEITPEEAVKITVSFMAKRGVTTSQTYTYTAENKFLGRDLSFKLATLTSGLAAASNIPLKRLVVNFEKNTVLDHNTGTVQPSDVLNQGFRITGEVELDYQGRTYADYMSDGTYNAMRIQLTNSRVLIGATSRPQFTLDLSKVEFDQWESTFANDEIAKQKFNFMALWDITNGNLINACTLVNAQSSY